MTGLAAAVEGGDPILRLRVLEDRAGVDALPVELLDEEPGDFGARHGDDRRALG